MKIPKFLKDRRMNKRGWAWLLAAVPTALAALVWGINALITPKPGVGSTESIISSIPIWGWVVLGLIILVIFLKKR